MVMPSGSVASGHQVARRLPPSSVRAMEDPVSVAAAISETSS